MVYQRARIIYIRDCLAGWLGWAGLEAGVVDGWWVKVGGSNGRVEEVEGREREVEGS